MHFCLKRRFFSKRIVSLNYSTDFKACSPGVSIFLIGLALYSVVLVRASDQRVEGKLSEVDNQMTVEADIFVKKYPSDSVNSDAKIIAAPSTFVVGVKNDGRLYATANMKFWNRPVTVEGNQAIEIEKWRHIAFVYDANALRLGLFVDGRLEGESDIPSYHDTALNIKQNGKMYVYPGIPRNTKDSTQISRDPAFRVKQSEGGEAKEFDALIKDAKLWNSAELFGGHWTPKTQLTLQTLRYRNSLLLTAYDSRIPDESVATVRLSIYNKNTERILQKEFSMSEARKGIQVSTEHIGPGDYHVQVESILKDDTAKMEIDRAWRHTETSLDVTSINADNVLMVEGKPFFPLGIYHVRTKNFATVAKAGLNFVSTDNSNPEYFNAAQSDEYVKKAADSGLKVLMDGYQLLDGRKSANIPPPESYRNDGRILGWQVDDEPIKTDHLVSRYENGIREDPSHPMYLCQDKLGSKLELTAEATDILSTDPYTFSSLPSKMVEFWTLDARRVVRDLKPVWTVIQLYTFTSNNPAIPGWNDLPRPDKLRAESFLALAAGARGLMYYSLDDTYHKTSTERGVNVVEEFPDAWKQYVPIFLEIQKYSKVWTSKLSPVKINNRGKDVSVSQEGFSYEGALWIISVNPSKSAEAEMWVELEGRKILKAEDVLGGNTPIVLGNTIKGKIPPYGVRLYKISLGES